MSISTNNVFTDKRKEGDIDLVSEITQLFKEANHPNPTAWLGNELVQQAAQEAPKLQRFLINRHWRLKLGMCSQSTVAERFCLLDEGREDDYLKVFKEVIVPVIVRHSL